MLLAADKTERQTFQTPAVEMPAQLNLSSVAGFNGSVPNGLVLHPDGRSFIYPLGSTICIRHIGGKGSQKFLHGHTDKVCATVWQTPLAPCRGTRQERPLAKTRTLSDALCFRSPVWRFQNAGAGWRQASRHTWVSRPTSSYGTLNKPLSCTH